jgi:hypothetical protein
MADPFNEAEAMARLGYGADDIHVALKSKGLTKYEARLAVFGKAAAMRMEARERSKVREILEVAS